jgi:uncharacterized protein YhfF
MKKFTSIMLTLAFLCFSFGAFAQPTAAPSAPPSAPSTNIISIYGTDTYTPITGVNAGPDWGQTGQGSTIGEYDIPGTDPLHKVLKYGNLSYQGIEFPAQDVSSMKWLHMDIWTEDAAATPLWIALISGAQNIALEKTITTAGSWFSLDIDLSEYVGSTLTSINQLMFTSAEWRTFATNTSSATIYVDNIYFWTDVTPSVVISESTLSLDADDASTGTFDITATGTWTVASDQTWLTPSSASGSGDATITLTATANTLLASRTATVKVTGSDNLEVTVTVTQNGIPVSDSPTPTRAAVDVNALFSDGYTPLDGNFIDFYGTSFNEESSVTSGNLVQEISSICCFGFEFVNETGAPAPANLSAMDTLHVDIYATTAPSITIGLVAGGEFKKANIPLTADTWNSLDIPLSDFGAATLNSVNQVGFWDVNGGLYMDNLYFYREATAPATARVQVIHNSADAAAASVDVYLDDALLLDNFAFRTASSFIDAPAGTEFTITIAPDNSASKDDGIWNKAYTLEANKTYILIADGIVSASGYDPATAFDLSVYDMGREAANTSGKTDVLVHHGSTDAPTVDVAEVKVPAGTIVDDISYGEFQGYLSLDPAIYSLQVRTADGTTPVAQFGADLSTLGDAAITVVASGFLDPAKNSGGEAFGLFVATAAGGALLALPAEDLTLPTARVQVIHNSADAAAASVDVYLDDALLLDNFAFRTASSFIDAPAGTEFTITIAPDNSASKDDGIWNKAYTLEENKTYILIADGIVSTSGYDPATAFDLSVYDMGREAATTSGKTDVLVHHGSTDAPTVDVAEVKVPAGTIVDDISYGEFQGYLSLDPAVYSLRILSADGATSVAQFGADLSNLGDAAITVVASGFLTPGNNSNGPAFGLFVATATGGSLLELPSEALPTSVSEFGSTNIRTYPNPVQSNLYIDGLSVKASVKIFDMSGKTIS